MNLSRPNALQRHRQSGFGLLQAMLILLLVGAALASGAVLLQAKRAPQQAGTQEQTLRWADEAIAAFAATHARLPCPANVIGGEEQCDDPTFAKGWLPARTLLGASGNGMPLGPVAYMVYRGDPAAHLDLTRPGNAYQPPLIDGSAREIISTDDKGEETGRRGFTAINGLDLCRSLELAQHACLTLSSDASQIRGWAFRLPRPEGGSDVAYIKPSGPLDCTDGQVLYDWCLDGGKVVFLLIEGVTGHAVPEKIQSGLTVAAFALLFGLMIFATYNDILRLIAGAM